MAIVVNKLRLGTDTINKYYVGSDKLCRAYMGDTLVFDDDTCVSEAGIDLGCGNNVVATLGAIGSPTGLRVPTLGPYTDRHIFTPFKYKNKIYAVTDVGYVVWNGGFVGGTITNNSFSWGSEVRPTPIGTFTYNNATREKYTSTDPYSFSMDKAGVVIIGNNKAEDRNPNQVNYSNNTNNPNAGLGIYIGTTSSLPTFQADTSSFRSSIRTMGNGILISAGTKLYTYTSSSVTSVGNVPLPSGVTGYTWAAVWDMTAVLLTTDGLYFGSPANSTITWGAKQQLGASHGYKYATISDDYCYLFKNLSNNAPVAMVKFSDSGSSAQMTAIGTGTISGVLTNGLQMSSPEPVSGNFVRSTNQAIRVHNLTLETIRSGRTPDNDIPLKTQHIYHGDIGLLPNGILLQDSDTYAYPITLSTKTFGTSWTRQTGQVEFTSLVYNPDDSTVYTSDYGTTNWFAYSTTGSAAASKNWTGATANTNTEGATYNASNKRLYAADGNDTKIYVYRFASNSFSYQSSEDFSLGFWATGICTLSPTELLVARDTSRNLYVLNISNTNSLSNQQTLTNFLDASNTHPFGLERVGSVLYVVDRDEEKIFTYCLYNLLNPAS